MRVLLLQLKAGESPETELTVEIYLMFQSPSEKEFRGNKVRK